MAASLPLTGAGQDLAVAGLAAGDTAAAEVLLSVVDKVRPGREEQVLAAPAAASGTGLGAGDLTAASDDPYGRRILA